MIFSRLRAGIGCVLAMAGALSLHMGCSSSSSEQPRAASPPEKAEVGTVVARVNGEPIHEKELLAGLPADMFGEGLDQAREDRLARLIDIRLIQQFAKAQEILVDEKEVEKELATLRDSPPSMGCRCCYYQSLDDFLKQNCLTLEDLRADIRNGLALTRHVDLLWEEAYPTEQARQELLKSKGADIRGTYHKVWHIYFSSGPARAGATDDEIAEMDRRAMEGAAAASKRLAQGARFEDLAKELSEDKRTADEGGLVGILNTEFPLFSTIMPSEIDKLKAGEVSPPLRSAVGYHLIKWGAVSDAEALDLLKNEFCQKAEADVLRDLPAAARIERPKKPEGADRQKE